MHPQPYQNNNSKTKNAITKNHNFGALKSLWSIPLERNSKITFLKVT